MVFLAPDEVIKLSWTNSHVFSTTLCIQYIQEDTREVDPNLIWQNDKQTKNVRKITAFEPWTSRQEIPGFDYKTSYQVALPYVFEYNRFIETPDIAKMREVDGYNGYEELQSHYKSITGTSYVQNFGKTEPGEFSSFLNNFDSMNNLLKTKDLTVESNNLSEYRTTYKWHISDKYGEDKDRTNEVLCKLPKIFKEIQPSFDADGGGALKERDIYRSQTRSAHHYISPVKVMKANETLGREGNIKVYSNPNPIDPHLRLPFQQAFFPKKTKPVPHRGMITESKESYTRQVDFFAPTDTVRKVETFVIKPSPKEDMIKEMNKNYTYYDHIGHNWRTVYS